MPAQDNPDFHPPQITVLSPSPTSPPPKPVRSGLRRFTERKTSQLTPAQIAVGLTALTLFVAGAVVLLLSLGGNEYRTPAFLAGTKEFVDPKLNFSLTYPGNYKEKYELRKSTSRMFCTSDGYLCLEIDTGKYSNPERLDPRSWYVKTIDSKSTSWSEAVAVNPGPAEFTMGDTVGIREDVKDLGTRLILQNFVLLEDKILLISASLNTSIKSEKSDAVHKERLSKLATQVVFSFQRTQVSQTTPTPRPVVREIRYKLPAGWKSVQSTDRLFEIGYHPELFSPTSQYSEIQLTSNTCCKSFSLRLWSYTDESPHQFIYSKLNVVGSETLGKTESTFERSYLFGGRQALFIYNILFFKTTAVGMLDAGGGYAFLITAAHIDPEDIELFLGSIRLVY